MAYPSDEDDNALPWLEPADSDEDDDDGGGGFPYRGLIVAGLAIVAIVAVLWFVAERFGGGAPGRDDIAVTDEVPLIQAPDGPYKVRPADPGGLDVDTGSLTHSVAEGGDPGSRIALDALPEEPVPVTAPPPVAPQAKTPPPAAAKLQPANDDAAVKRPPTPIPAKPVPVETPKPAPRPEPAKPAAASGGVTVQLGAFASAATADRVWGKLAGRVSALGGLKKSVPSVEAGGKTLYRLRAGGIASAAEADKICAAVKAAGEQCVVVR